MMIMILSSIKTVSRSTSIFLLKNRCANSYSCLLASPSSVDPSSSHRLNVSAKDVVASFKKWFNAPNTAFLDRIFNILNSQDSAAPENASVTHAAELALSNLNLRLTESFVLEVLSYGRSSKDVLSCLKFFDWAGRQPGFNHTQATFHAIFKILSRKKLMSLMLDFLQDIEGNSYIHRVRFHDTLVMGYALAGKPGIALQLFGRMRFQGLDLDGIAYHVFLNALVEEKSYDAADMIAEQISLRGLENHVTHSILVKRWCKENKLDEAEAHLRRFKDDKTHVIGNAVGIIVGALCKRKKFNHAASLLNEFAEVDVPIEHAYGVWLHYLVQHGRLNGTFELVNTKKLLDGNVPHLFRYNMLVLRLLMENRLNDVCDLLIEMGKEGIPPDKVTMNAVLCFFCKAGMMDVAIELYNSRSEFGLSLNNMAYNYLINVLCWKGGSHEAYNVLRNSIEEGFFPGQKTFSILADALCREGKLDKLKELLLFSLELKFKPNYSICDMLIAALCKANRVEDGYLIHGELSKMTQKTARNTYFHLIHGFSKSNRADIAATLLLEMQEKGHKPTRKLFRTVICCMCSSQSPENQFLKLLEMQLSHFQPSAQNFHFFIYGAGCARKPELAREVYEIMQRSGIKPTLRSDIILLRSYLKSGRISDALKFFNDVRQRRSTGPKFYSSMVIGLCKVNKADYALNFMRETRNNKICPSMSCYEYLIKVLCMKKSYGLVVDILNDLEKTRGHVTSFIGNILLLNSFQSKELYEAWIQSREIQDETESEFSLLGQLIGTFSGCIELSEDIENLEEIIEQCFPLNLFTYNILLKKLSAIRVERAFEMFDWICQKGYEPNRWTYEIIIHSLLRRGRRTEARRWIEEMYRKGFDQTAGPKLLI